MSTLVYMCLHANFYMGLMSRGEGVLMSYTQLWLSKQNIKGPFHKYLVLVVWSNFAVPGRQIYSHHVSF